MAAAKWVYYDGNNSGFALVLPPGEEDGKANLIVFDQENGTSGLVRDVPRRAKDSPDGTGNTFRDNP